MTATGTTPGRPAHSGIAWAIDIGTGIGVFVLVAAVLLSMTDDGPSERDRVMGEVLGKMALPLIGAAVFAKRMARARKWLGMGLGIAVVLVISLLLVVPPVIGRVILPARTPTLTAADRAPLKRVQRQGQGWLVHPTLGFELRDPGAEMQPADVRGQLAQLDLSTAYVYTFTAEGVGGLVVTIGPGRETDLDSVTTGAMRALEASSATVTRRERSGRGASSRVDLRATVSDVPSWLRFTLMPHRQHGFYTIVGVNIAPADNPALIASLESLRATGRSAVAR